jgi:hypothetical protein
MMILATIYRRVQRAIAVPEEAVAPNVQEAFPMNLKQAPLQPSYSAVRMIRVLRVHQNLWWEAERPEGLPQEEQATKHRRWHRY